MAVITPPRSPLGRIVRRLRQEREWSQKELAEKIHKTQAYVSVLERGGHRDLKGSIIVELAKVFGVPYDTFFQFHAGDRDLPPVVS